MLRFITVLTASLSLTVLACAEDLRVATTARTTRVDSTDTGICPRNTVIIVSKCNSGTLIVCGSQMDEGSFTCDRDGIPVRLPPVHSTTLPPAAAPSAPVPQITPSAARPRTYVLPRSYSRSVRYRHGQDHKTLFDFLGSLFKGKRK